MTAAQYITALILAIDPQEAIALLKHHGATQEQADQVWQYLDHSVYYDAGGAAPFANIERSWEAMVRYVECYF